MKLSKNPKAQIYLLSLSAIAFLVWLIYFRAPAEVTEEMKLTVSWLSSLNAFLNSCSAIFIGLGYFFIKRKKIKAHKLMMMMAFLTSACFLISYIIYHFYHGDTKFLGTGFIRPIYFFILISHIILSIVALPLVLSSFYLGLTENIKEHRKIAKITFPIWMYVSVTGVMIYFLLNM